jgi:hypothetical protein
MNAGDLLEVIDHYGENDKIVLGGIDGRRQQFLVPVGTLCVFFRYTSPDKRKVVVLCSGQVGWLWKEEVKRVDRIANASAVIDSDHADVSIGSLAEKQQT